MRINDIYEKLRGSLNGVSILFHRSILSIKIDGKKEIIIEMLKNNKANMYLIGYRAPMEERDLEIRDQVLFVLTECGLEVNYKASFHDYLVRTLVKRHEGMLFKSGQVMILYKRNDKGDFDEFPTSYNQDEEYYIISGNRPELEEEISVSKKN